MVWLSCCLYKCQCHVMSRHVTETLCQAPVSPSQRSVTGDGARPGSIFCNYLNGMMLDPKLGFLINKSTYMTNIVCCQISLLFSSYFQLEQVICSTSKYSPLQRPLPGSGTGDCGLSCLSHSFNTGRVGALTERSRLDYIRYQVVTQAGLFMLEM